MSMHQSELEGLQMYVIYNRPLDYPGNVVLRRWIVNSLGGLPDPEPVILTGSVAEARTHVPVGLVNIGRQPDDEDQIVEVWV